MPRPSSTALTLRDVAKLKPGRVHYTAWCDDEGHVLDDGTLFRLSPRRASGSAARSGICRGCSTARSASTSTIEEETEAVAGLALQGPTSFAVLREAGFDGVERLKVFDLAEFPA